MLLGDLVVLILDEVGLGIVSGSQDELLVMSLAAIASLLCLIIGMNVNVFLCSSLCRH